MATLFTESFTGSNGATPGHLVLGKNPTTGGGATIQSNRLDLATGTSSGAYNAANKVFRALSVNGTSALSAANIGISFTLQVSGPETYFTVPVRSTQAATAYDGATQYTFEFRHGNSTINIIKGVNYTYTTLATQAFTFSTSTTYFCRVEVSGTILKLFIGATALPAIPTLTATDTSAPITAAGLAFLNADPGGNATSNHAYIDNLSVDDVPGFGEPATAMLAAVMRSNVY